jgi:hypothetical protein
VLLWSPQPIAAVIASAQAMSSIIAFRRRKDGVINKTANATTLPPPHSFRTLAVEVAVVLMVTVVVALSPDAMTTLAGFKLRVPQLRSEWRGLVWTSYQTIALGMTRMGLSLLTEGSSPFSPLPPPLSSRA